MTQRRHKQQSGGMFLKVILPVLIAGACAIGYFVYKSNSLTDKEKITQIVHQLVDDAQHKNIRGILDRMTQDYSDNIYKTRKQIAEHMKMWAVHQFTTEVIMKAENLEIKINPSDDKATAEFNVTGNKSIEEVKRHYHSKGLIRLHFVKREGEWLLKSTEPLN